MMRRCAETDTRAAWRGYASRLAALAAPAALVALMLVAAGGTAGAQGLHGLSVRVGGYFPANGSVRSITDAVAWGGGLEYAVPWRVPNLFNGQNWSTSISADFHYSQRKSGIFRYFPVTINQVYTFEEQSGHTPYAGFSLGAATYGTTGAAERVSTTTRFMGGLILGLNIDQHFYIEGRYDWVGRCMVDPSGFRAYLGYRL